MEGKACWIRRQQTLRRPGGPARPKKGFTQARTPPHRLIQEAVPDTLVWAANDTFPALGQGLFPTCRHLSAGRRLRALAPPGDPAPGPSHQTSESAPPMLPTSASVGALLSTLRPVFALRRPTRLLPLLDRSDLERHRSPAAEPFFFSSCARPCAGPGSPNGRARPRDKCSTGVPAVVLYASCGASPARKLTVILPAERITRDWTVDAGVQSSLFRHVSSRLLSLFARV